MYSVEHSSIYVHMNCQFHNLRTTCRPSQREVVDVESCTCRPSQSDVVDVESCTCRPSQH